MKKILSLLFLILLLLTASSCAKKDVDPYEGYDNLSDLNYIASSDLVSETNPVVKWEGRYEYKEATSDARASVYIYHTATGFTIDFVGTSLTVEFYHSNSNIYYNVALDDETLPNPKAGRTICLPDEETLSSITIVSDLEWGKHTVKCLKMDEAKDALTSVISFETDGKFVLRDSEEDNSNFKFMFVCASGGSGYGSLGYYTTNEGHQRTRANSSSLHAFNYLTARMFDADVEFIATSGWGVKYPQSIYEILDYTGNTPDNSVSAAQTTASWDYTRSNPDVIIFNIGGNDTTSSGFNKVTYQEYVVKMVSKLHQEYPNAKMIWTHTSSNAGTYAVSALTDAGIMKEDYIKVVIIPKVGAGETGIGTYGASSHNSIKTHIDTALILANALHDYWGYTMVRENIVFEDFESILYTD